MWLFQLRWTRKCYREKKIIYGYRLLLEIKISALSLRWKKKRKVLCAGKGQVQAYNGSFCQLSFVSTKCYIPFTGDEYRSCLQTDLGWLGVDCRHFKVILLHLCLCFSSAYFQFAVVLEPCGPELTIRKWKRDSQREGERGEERKKERHGDPSSDGAKVF